MLVRSSKTTEITFMICMQACTLQRHNATTTIIIMTTQTTTAVANDYRYNWNTLKRLHHTINSKTGSEQ